MIYFFLNWSIIESSHEVSNIIYIYIHNISCYLESKWFCLDFFFGFRIAKAKNSLLPRCPGALPQPNERHLAGWLDGWCRQASSILRPVVVFLDRLAVVDCWWTTVSNSHKACPLSSKSPRQISIHCTPKIHHVKDGTRKKDARFVAWPRQTCWMPAFRNSRHFVIWSWSLPVRCLRLLGLLETKKFFSEYRWCICMLFYWEGISRYKVLGKGDEHETYFIARLWGKDSNLGIEMIGR